jgi:hypothetical protein
MHGAIPPLPQYAFMAWYSFKKSTGTVLPLPLLMFVMAMQSVLGNRDLILYDVHGLDEVCPFESRRTSSQSLRTV